MTDDLIIKSREIIARSRKSLAEVCDACRLAYGSCQCAGGSRRTRPEDRAAEAAHVEIEQLRARCAKLETILALVEEPLRALSEMGEDAEDAELLADVRAALAERKS